mmetsp:Transcript_23232/g.65228  ORF Transcript_23232/g.65228 Transcript_23232/m.65228 type:complete len:121 (+) Transcript_23232:113-475(+)|eukprot:CAMPEP_0119131102 /NCGR_PEP_ID=MMETSP1310-20130426/9445_1 /TAXON_ID=464262 /ORGANISM="Genus nov. species nov., Strain RCC2339" /LENGTH=120 /DNA_ID=CAMNT_0007121655 /DNA_START=88 /DNA_END=450 /DNA_ORIENTATION=-
MAAYQGLKSAGVLTAVLSGVLVFGARANNHAEAARHKKEELALRALKHHAHEGDQKAEALKRENAHLVEDIRALSNPTRGAEEGIKQLAESQAASAGSEDTLDYNSPTFLDDFVRMAEKL